MKKELIKILPCGDELIVVKGNDWRRYELHKTNGDINTIWSPHKVHRTALLEAIVADDAIKYIEQKEQDNNE